MTLDREDLLVLVHNAINTYIDSDGYLNFSRFSEKQQKQYIFYSRNMNSNYDKITLASSNIVLDFVTDSDRLGMYYSWESSTGYDSAIFDLYVDGKLTDYRATENKAHNILCFDLPSGEHRVTLYLPWQVIVRIKSVVLSDNAIVKEMKKDKKILAFGDSITQGYICKHPSLSYVGCITRKFDAECINQGVGGFLFEGNSIDPDLKNWNPDLITVAYGCNDYMLRDTLASYKSGTEGFMATLHNIFDDTPVLGILPIFRTDERFIARQKMLDYSLEEAHEVIRNCYKKYSNVTLMEDYYFPMCKDFFAPDLIHPNDLGFMIYGEAVTSKIKDIMRWD